MDRSWSFRVSTKALRFSLLARTRNCALVLLLTRPAPEAGSPVGVRPGAAARARPAPEAGIPSGVRPAPEAGSPEGVRPGPEAVSPDGVRPVPEAGSPEGVRPG